MTATEIVHLSPGPFSFSIAMICSSLNLLCFIDPPPSSIQKWKIPARNGPGNGERVTFFSVLYNIGARVSEVIGLRVGDVVTEASPTAHLRGKGRKERSIPLWRPTATLIRGWKKQLGDLKDESFLFLNRSGGKLTRSNVTQRLALVVATAGAACPRLAGRTISPHTIRHTTAMHLLQSGVDITVIALWLGHESTTTTHTYLEADLSMKERALERLQPPGTKAARYRPPDQLMQFLMSL